MVLKANRFRLINTLGLLFFLFANAFSQSKINVVTKEVDKTFSVLSKSITIDAEKADIIINKSKDNKFYLKLKFISKHKNLDIAKEQLGFLNHVIREGKRDIFLHNYILIDANSNLKARIKTVYFLSIPDNYKMKIKNSMGEIKISGTSGSFDINVSYGRLIIENSKGKLDGKIHVGDLFINACNLISTINVSHTTSNIRNSVGEFVLKTNMGSLNFGLKRGLSELVVNSNGTEINLNNKKCLEFNLDITSDYGSIYINKCGILSDENIITDTRNKPDKKQFRYQNNNVTQFIKISNKHSNIYIN